MLIFFKKTGPGWCIYYLCLLTLTLNLGDLQAVGCGGGPRPLVTRLKADRLGVGFKKMLNC